MKNMWKIIVIIFVSIVSLVGGYGFVSGGNLVFNPEVRFAASVSSDVYLDSQENLNSTVVIYQSNVDLKNAHISSVCNVSSELLTESKGLYFFKLDYSNDIDCENGNIVLSLGDDNYANTIHSLKLVKDQDMYNIYLDFSSEKLKEYQKQIHHDLKEFAIYKDYDKKDILKYYTFFLGQRKYQNALYKNEIINKILLGREKKYSSPVNGRDISTIPNRVPNAGRPYRAGYTDGIHHGWDIYTEFGENVVALDDAIVVRVVDGFQDSDFSRIVYGESLSLEQELKNLDILRGNQVWLKTMKGEVVFYSHLDFIEGGIKEGDMVKRGELLGKVGVSGVPEEGYDHYHLHFSIMQNPYNYLMAGTYDFGDYMEWDWLTRGMTYSQTIEEQKNIFE